MDEASDGVKSPYTPKLIALLEKWPPQGLSTSFSTAYKIVGIRTPKNTDYVGTFKQMWIDAPIGKVEAVLDDFPHYKSLFPGFKDVHVISRDENKVLVSFEKPMPIFIPNVRYTMVYLTDKRRADRKIYRFMLKNSNNLKASDGLVVLDEIKNAQGRPQTRYTVLELYLADWGPVKTFAPGRMWTDTFRGAYISDMSIKMKAEHPDWDYDRIAKLRDKLGDKFNVDAVKSMDHFPFEQ